MIADKVEVNSLKIGDKQAYKWISDGKSGYTLEKSKNTVGTDILIYLNDEGKEANRWQIEQIVKKYSGFILPFYNYL